MIQNVTSTPVTHQSSEHYQALMHGMMIEREHLRRKLDCTAAELKLAKIQLGEIRRQLDEARSEVLHARTLRSQMSDKLGQIESALKVANVETFER